MSAELLTAREANQDREDDRRLNKVHAANPSQLNRASPLSPTQARCPYCNWKLNAAGECENCRAADRQNQEDVAQAERWQEEIGLRIPESIRQLAELMDVRTERRLAKLNEDTDRVVADVLSKI